MVRFVVELLDFLQTRGLPPAAVRVRIALDVAEHEADAATADRGPRVTLASVHIDEEGRAAVPPSTSHGHLATLLWEILAGRAADSDELPWSDPAEDLPAGVLDTFASLTLRPARDLAELRRRFTAGIRSHAASHDEVARALSGLERITLRAPPVQIEQLRTLSAGEALPATPVEDGIVTRVCPVVTLPVAVVAEPVDEKPRTTLDPWNAPPFTAEVTETSSTVAVEAEPPRRRRTWPFVAASLAAALVVLGLAGRERMANPTPTPATQPREAGTAPPESTEAPSTAAHPVAPAPSAVVVPTSTSSATVRAVPSPASALTTAPAQRFRSAPLVRPAAPASASSAAAAPDATPPLAEAPPSAAAQEAPPVASPGEPAPLE